MAWHPTSCGEHPSPSAPEGGLLCRIRARVGCLSTGGFTTMLQARSQLLFSIITVQSSKE
uniref:Uncharacterized protein n=1 Tax=Arundo donax TaxID=35708 RepID=A0A0A9CCK0_ARUDO